MMNGSEKTKRLVLGGVMIALATVLSLVKVFQLPYGGAITLCSMLPIMFYAYRYGAKWGCFAGFIYGVIQMLLGGNIAAPTTAILIGIVIFDYLLAFTVLGFAGIFKSKIKNDAGAFTLGIVVAATLRYICHIISGAVFFGQYAEWFFVDMNGPFGEFAMSNLSGAGLGTFYSVIYNGTFMVPEIIISGVVGFVLIKLAGKQILGNEPKKIETTEV